ncbi:MAG TPA: DUF1570 domain-containing protein [Lacipirellulaceae bacterium]|nr:DUF1570 domain-containing protein [Lacipirellulaceae bacterium]
MPHSPAKRMQRLAVWLAACGLAAAPAGALEHVVVRQQQGERKLSGEVIVEAQNGIVLKTADDSYHRLLTPTIRSRTKDSTPLEMLDAQKLGEQLLSELPPGFQVHHSKNYVVCFNTTRTYAKWTSSLLERLQKAFIIYWQKRGLTVAPPKHPLPVIVFSDQASYAEFAKAELGAAVNNVIGYYNLESNRITMYDLTGMQAERRDEYGRGSMHDISELLSTDEAEPLVATIVHEATHQISFNCGVQTRLVDNPLWMSEGLAVYFETPDLSSSRSWSGIGVNYSRWDRFLDNLDADRVPPLSRLVADDELFRDPETAVDSYSQAWAWNYFLIKWRPKQYAAYLKDVAAQEVLSQPDPKVRLGMFRKHFGADFDALEDEFFRQMRRIE